MEVTKSINKTYSPLPNIGGSIFVFPVLHLCFFYPRRCIILLGWLWVTVSIFIDWDTNQDD